MKIQILNNILSAIKKFSGICYTYLNRLNPTILISILVIIFIAFSWITRDYLGFSGDMAEYCNNPVRVLEGEIPYKDFLLVYSPGEVYIPAAIYKIFGTNTDTLRFASILISALSAVPAFLFGRKLFEKNNFYSLLFTLVYFYSSVIFFYCGPDYIHFFYIFIFLSVILIYSYIIKNKEIYLLLGGFILGLGLFFRVYETLAAGLGLYLTIIFYNFRRNPRFLNSLIKSSLFLPGIILNIILLSLAFYDIFDIMFNQLIFLSLDNGAGVSLPYFHNLNIYIINLNDDVAGVFHNFNIRDLLAIPYHFVKSIVALYYYILIAITIIVFILFIKRENSINIKAVALLFFGWSIFSFLKAASRADLAHLAPFIAPALMFFLVVLYFSRETKRNKKDIALNAIVIVSLIIGLSSIFTPITRAVQVYSKPTYEISNEFGSVSFDKSEDAENFRNLLEYIDNNTSPDDYIFVTDWFLPPMYVLTNRRNPTYFDSMNDLVILPSVEKQKNIIRDLIKSKTKLIIHNPDWGYDNLQERQFSSTCQVLQKFFDENCEQINKFGVYRVLKLKNTITNN